jgi:hypothetical protein
MDAAALWLARGDDPRAVMLRDDVVTDVQK